MIAEAEIRRYAARWGVDPMVVDLDYSLGWFLESFCSAGGSADLLRFKGGTCLRKCYFPDHRFSEDLDFTATAHLAADTLMDSVERATHWAADHDGPDFAAMPARLEVIEDEYGSESYQVRVYYRGPLRWGGSPRAIRLDVTRDERLLLPATPCHLFHVYSDAEALGQIEIACYALDEILAEKIRAVGGQRRFAISRDLYDIHQLIARGVALSEVLPLLPAKFEAKAMELEQLRLSDFEARRPEFEADWHRRLKYLLSDSQSVPVSFDDAWQTSLQVIGHIMK